MFSKRAGVWPFLALAIVLGIAALLARRTDLPPSYHHFADQRVWLSIPQFSDVASNIAFLIAGLWGLAFLPGSRAWRSSLMHVSAGRTSSCFSASCSQPLAQPTITSHRTTSGSFGTACR